MDDNADRFLDLIYSLVDVTDGMTPERAYEQFDETTLQVFWKKWPDVSQWAGSLWKMLSDELAGPATPHRDEDLDEVGDSGG